jgi:pimeloyl-ACP methyl ester carboxylesterase
VEEEMPALTKLARAIGQLVLLNGLTQEVKALSTEPSCHDVSFVVHAQANHTVFANTPDPNNETEILAWMGAAFASPTGPPTNGTALVGGKYQINGVYCPPQNQTVAKALQILVHGIGYNKTVWSGLGLGSQYDWQAAATAQGYATLAVDRLGHGTNPQHLDYLMDMQGLLQVDVVHKIIDQVRAGTGPLPKAFNKIVFIGHSYGSYVGTSLVRQHPTDVDVLVSTGYSAQRNFTNAGAMPMGSANRVAPKRFLSLPPGYLTVLDEPGLVAGYYAGNYDPSVPSVDFQRQDTVTVGELLTTGFGFIPATGFTRPTLVLAGEKDALFCAVTGTPCDQVLSSTTSMYPDVKHYEYYVVPNTGHDFGLHLSAPDSAKRVHQFLNQFF